MILMTHSLNVFLLKKVWQLEIIGKRGIFFTFSNSFVLYFLSIFKLIFKDLPDIDPVARLGFILQEFETLLESSEPSDLIHSIMKNLTDKLRGSRYK